MIEGYFPKEPTEYLRMAYNARKRRNSNYSIRAFARDIKLSPSHLSEVLSGKSLLSVKKVQHISEQIKLDGIHREHWIDLVEMKSKRTEKKKAARIRAKKRISQSNSSVSLEKYKLISDWYHFAILAFFGANTTYSLKELSENLGIDKENVQKAVQRLIKLDLLEKTEGGYQPKEETSFVGDDIPSQAIRDSHHQVLSKTSEALDNIGMDERDSQCISFSVPKHKVDQFRSEMKRRIFETISEFSENQLSKDDAQIEMLSWHLYPLKSQEVKSS